jgi:twitching motility protein PilJ
MAFTLFGIPLWGRKKTAAKPASPDQMPTTLAHSPMGTLHSGMPTAPDETASLKKGKEALIRQRTRIVNDRMKTLGILFGVISSIAIGLLVYQGRQSGYGTLYVYAAGEMRTLSQQIAKSAQLAVRGDPSALAELRGSRDRFNQLLGALSRGGSIDGKTVPPSPEGVSHTLELLSATWAKTEKDTGQLIGHEQSLVMLNQAVVTINETNPTLLDLTEQIASMKLFSGAAPQEVAEAHRLVMLSQRIAKNANAVLASHEIDQEMAILLGKDAELFNQLLDQLKRNTPPSSPARPRIADLEDVVRPGLISVNATVSNLSALIQAKGAGARILTDSGRMLTLSNALLEGYTGVYTGLNTMTLLIVVVGLLGLLALAHMAKIYNDDLAARQAETERQRRAAEDERNQSQQAILRLMNEMGDLADGDLTVRATVTEDITGAIADSVNYTIEELSVLVRRINDAASRVTLATESAKKTSTQLLTATQRQSTEIREAGSTVQRMAQSMTESSQRALQSAKVARRSLDTARKGADAVQSTIKGMTAIREKIQDTSKRIKRLGESSQEIGEIVELISDITEQTNVLALNAAIQAASAGEAGRGFTVVAEEVQRLAERSGEATKQISAIVKTIQTDTKDAVGAMENATHDVVEGASLSDAAGQALAEIETVSTEAARLIEEISISTQRQAAIATKVAQSMKGILSITEQTTQGTQQTAVSIGQLADLAIELKGSVSGFKV